MNDDLTTLASAYLDGEVTADERAQVESSDELLAEVDRLRTVRAVVSTTASHGDAPISMRERHLSTALDAWDRLPDTERTGALRDSTPSGADRAAAAGVAAMSSPARRTANRRWTQSPGWLGAAAAGLVLVLAGGLVLRNTTTDDTSDSELTSADASVAPEARTADADAAAAEEPTTASGGAESELEDATAAQAPAAPENGSDVQTDLDAEAPPSDDGSLEQLNTIEDLAVFASDAIDAPESAELPEGATVITELPAAIADEADEILEALELPLCQGADVVVGLAIYVDETVVVGIDESRNDAVAYRQDDCSLVARASLD
jgi:hypothetical protein